MARGQMHCLTRNLFWQVDCANRRLTPAIRTTNGWNGIRASTRQEDEYWLVAADISEVRSLVLHTYGSVAGSMGRSNTDSSSLLVVRCNQLLHCPRVLGVVSQTRDVDELVGKAAIETKGSRIGNTGEGLGCSFMVCAFAKTFKSTIRARRNIICACRNMAGPPKSMCRARLREEELFPAYSNLRRRPRRQNRAPEALERRSRSRPPSSPALRVGLMRFGSWATMHSQYLRQASVFSHSKLFRRQVG